MKRHLAAALALACLTTQAHAISWRVTAQGPVCGTVVSRSWHASTAHRGRPGAAGAQRFDRTVPAHLRVVLADYTGLDAASARRINLMVAFAEKADPPQRVMLHLVTDTPDFLKGARAICIEGLQVSRSEGGLVTRYTRVVVRG
jgi:hypothetical protein